MPSSSIPQPATASGIDVELAELIAMRQRASRFARPPQRVSGGRAATHESRFRGRGVDYVESRNYQPGDDIRQMDWRVTARTGRPHTKLFQEEREQSTFLLVDCNACMRFGTRKRFKSVQAARTAALIAWAAVLGGDRVGALGFGPNLNAEVKPGGGSRGALRVLRALAQWDALSRGDAAPVALSQALQRAHRLARPGCRIVLLTDGFSADAEAQAPLSMLAAHCEVVTILISDPLEQAAPPPARYAMRSESGLVTLDFAAAKTRKQWLELFARRRERMIDMLKRRALRWTQLETQEEPDAALARLLGLGGKGRSAKAKPA
ncbi:MAG: DUF58 domain-containing protein [Rudaea sp.]